MLRRCLDSIASQHERALEVIVVDNGSTDETLDVVRSSYPDVHLIANGENLGIVGRNIGFRAASGRIVLSLDDDVELVDPDTLCTVRSRFADIQDLGALTLKITETETGAEFVPHHWWHAKDRGQFQNERFETDRINEAAVAFDSAALKSVGYYYEALFWGGEEWDLVLGLLDAGYSIHYEPTAVLHLAPRGNLNEKADYRHALLVRNRFWIALRRLRWTDAVAFVAPRAVLWLFRAVRYGYLGHYMNGMADLVRRAPEILRDRRPISSATRQRVKRIRGGA